MAFRPAARTRSVSGMADVFRSDQTGEWSKTSVSMRPETRRRLKTYAAAHDMRIQEVIDLALEAYLARRETPCETSRCPNRNGAERHRRRHERAETGNPGSDRE